jgi:hypothetical protein
MWHDDERGGPVGMQCAHVDGSPENDIGLELREFWAAQAPRQTTPWSPTARYVHPAFDSGDSGSDDETFGTGIRLPLQRRQRWQPRPPVLPSKVKVASDVPTEPPLPLSPPPPQPQPQPQPQPPQTQTKPRHMRQ